MSEELPLSAADRHIIEADLAVIETLDERIERLQHKIDEIAATWEETQLLMTIPGIGPVLAVTIVTEIGEIERFDNKKEVVSYAGLDSAQKPRRELEPEQRPRNPMSISPSVARVILPQRCGTRHC